MFKKAPQSSSYAFCFNSPLVLMDADGKWPVYGKDGTYLGDDGRTEKGKDLAFVGEIDEKGGFINLKQFTASHTQFQISANIVRKEGTTNEAKEYLWIAHAANNAAEASNKTLYKKLMSGYSSVPKKQKVALSITNNTDNAKAARAGVIDVLSGGADPTNGAQFWDGTDFLAWGLKSPNGTPQNKFEEYSHIFIDVMIFNDFEKAQKERWGSSVKYGKKRYDIPAAVFDITKNPKNWSSFQESQTGTTFGFNYDTGSSGNVLSATGTAGESVFWRVDKKKTEKKNH